MNTQHPMKMSAIDNKRTSVDCLTSRRGFLVAISLSLRRSGSRLHRLRPVQGLPRTPGSHLRAAPFRAFSLRSARSPRETGGLQLHPDLSFRIADLVNDLVDRGPQEDERQERGHRHHRVDHPGERAPPGCSSTGQDPETCRSRSGDREPARGHATFSTARRRALRALGLRSTSASPGLMARRARAVSSTGGATGSTGPGSRPSPRRNRRLTIRSSSE